MVASYGEFYYDKDVLRELFEELGFNSLLRRFGAQVTSQESKNSETVENDTKLQPIFKKGSVTEIIMRRRMDQEAINNKYEQLKQIFSDCMQKLGIIEKKQREVVENLQKKTDNTKISKIKSEIEGL